MSLFLSDLFVRESYNLVAVIWSRLCFATKSSTSFSGKFTLMDETPAPMDLPSSSSFSFVNMMATGLGAFSS